ncbi:MAG: hypothetical protein BAJALOKI3v1_230012 [Promethearchaeota archaeon]|nr:MAG: hypothetical protein BAJALOKI3v1_230012 [Candidatus Lokiarchaeota archaeon]
MIWGMFSIMEIMRTHTITEVFEKKKILYMFEALFLIYYR